MKRVFVCDRAGKYLSQATHPAKRHYRGLPHILTAKEELESSEHISPSLSNPNGPLRTC